MSAEKKFRIKSSRVKKGLYLNGYDVSGWPIYNQNSSDVASWNYSDALRLVNHFNTIEPKRGWVIHNWTIEEA